MTEHEAQRTRLAPCDIEAGLTLLLEGKTTQDVGMLLGYPPKTVSLLAHKHGYRYIYYPPRHPSKTRFNLGYWKRDADLTDDERTRIVFKRKRTRLQESSSPGTPVSFSADLDSLTDSELLQQANMLLEQAEQTMMNMRAELSDARTKVEGYDALRLRLQEVEQQLDADRVDAERWRDHQRRERERQANISRTALRETMQRVQGEMKLAQQDQ